MLKLWICFLQTHSFSLHKMLTGGLESYWLLVGYCDVFNQLFGLSFWRHPFTAEDPLVNKWFNAQFLQTNMFLWRSKLGWPEGEYIFCSKWQFLFNFSWMYILYVYKGSKKLLVGDKSKIYLSPVLSLTLLFLMAGFLSTWFFNSSHIYFYSAFHNTGYAKAASQWWAGTSFI